MSTSPQNPVFSVDPTAMDALLPKGKCGRCGTIMAVRVKTHGRVSCPACGAVHRAEQTPQGLQVRLLDADA